MAGLFPALLLFSAACGDPPPVQLEALEALIYDPSGESQDLDAQVVTGLLEVSGEGRDLVLRVVPEAGAPLEVAVHLPGESNLRSLDGRHVTLDVGGTAVGPTDRTFSIYDDSGLVFLGEYSWALDSRPLQLGDDFVTWGAGIWTGGDVDYQWTFTTAVFQTDDREVELLPGEVAELQVGGQIWRVVVNAAYVVEESRGPFSDGCAQPGSLLSYELLRLDDTAAVVDTLAFLEPETQWEMQPVCGVED